MRTDCVTFSEDFFSPQGPGFPVCQTEVGGDGLEGAKYQRSGEPQISQAKAPLSLGVSLRVMNGKGPAVQRIKCLATGQRIGSAGVTEQYCKGKPGLALSFIAWLSVSVGTGQNPQWALINGTSSTGLWKESRILQVYNWQEARSCSQVKKREGSKDSVPS